MLDLKQLSAQVQRRVRDPLPEKLWKYLPPFRPPSRLGAAPRPPAARRSGSNSRQPAARER